MNIGQAKARARHIARRTDNICDMIQGFQEFIDSDILAHVKDPKRARQAIAKNEFLRRIQEYPKKGLYQQLVEEDPSKYDGAKDFLKTKLRLSSRDADFFLQYCKNYQEPKEEKESIFRKLADKISGIRSKRRDKKYEKWINRVKKGVKEKNRLLEKEADQMYFLIGRAQESEDLSESIECIETFLDLAKQSKQRMRYYPESAKQVVLDRLYALLSAGTQPNEDFYLNLEEKLGITKEQAESYVLHKADPEFAEALERIQNIVAENAYHTPEYASQLLETYQQGLENLTVHTPSEQEKQTVAFYTLGLLFKWARPDLFRLQTPCFIPTKKAMKIYEDWFEYIQTNIPDDYVRQTNKILQIIDRSIEREIRELEIRQDGLFDTAMSFAEKGIRLYQSRLEYFLAFSETYAHLLDEDKESLEIAKAQIEEAYKKKLKSA